MGRSLQRKKGHLVRKWSGSGGDGSPRGQQKIKVEGSWVCDTKKELYRVTCTKTSSHRDFQHYQLFVMPASKVSTPPTSTPPPALPASSSSPVALPEPTTTSSPTEPEAKRQKQQDDEADQDVDSFQPLEPTVQTGDEGPSVPAIPADPPFRSSYKR